MKNLIFVPFAFDPSKQTGVNVKKRNVLNTYLKNLCVATASIKKYNPDADVAVVCNFEIPLPFKQILENNQILILVEEFDSFTFPNDYKWNLAFYKLCALEKVVAHYQYDNYVYMDTDSIVQNSLDGVFEELADNILLYDINLGLGVKEYRIILDEFRQFGITSHITHYGGEFFAASHENAKKFIFLCKEIYEKMIETGFVTSKGDEFILSIAASYCKEIVKNAGAYVFRFWTNSFYLVSTCYKYNAVAILHLPGEKNKSILKIFNRYVKRGKFPHKKRVHRLCHLIHRSPETIAKQIVKKILRKD